MTTNIASLNRTMQNALRSVDFDKVSTELETAARKVKAAASTTLDYPGENKGGQLALTAELKEVGTALLDAATPAIESLVEAMPDSSDANLIAILESAATTLDNTFTHVVAGSPSLEGVKAQLQTAADNIGKALEESNLKETLEEIAESDFIEDVTDVAEKAVEELSDAVAVVAEDFTTAFNQVLSGGTSLAGDIAGDLSDALSAAASLVPALGQVAGTFSLSPLQNMINTLDPSQPIAFARLGLGGGLAVEITNLLQNNQVDLAVNSIQTLPQNLNTPITELQQNLTAIPLDVSKQVTPPVSVKNVTVTTQATTQPFRPTSLPESVPPRIPATPTTTTTAAATTTTTTTAPTPAPTPSAAPGRSIRTYQELELTMKGIKRSVTEMLIYHRFGNSSGIDSWGFDKEMRFQNARYDARGSAYAKYKDKPQMHMYVDMEGNIIAGAPFEYEPEIGFRAGQNLTLKVMFFTLFSVPLGSTSSYLLGKAKERNQGFSIAQIKTMDKILRAYKSAYPSGRLFYTDVQNENGIPESTSTTLKGSSVVQAAASRLGIQNYGMTTEVLTEAELKAAVDAAIGVG